MFINDYVIMTQSAIPKEVNSLEQKKRGRNKIEYYEFHILRTLKNMKIFNIAFNIAHIVWDRSNKNTHFQYFWKKQD